MGYNNGLLVWWWGEEWKLLSGDFLGLIYGNLIFWEQNKKNSGLILELNLVFGIISSILPIQSCVGAIANRANLCEYFVSIHGQHKIHGICDASSSSCSRSSHICLLIYLRDNKSCSSYGTILNFLVACPMYCNLHFVHEIR